MEATRGCKKAREEHHKIFFGLYNIPKLLGLSEEDPVQVDDMV